jgi:hypothetical protein
MNTNERRIRPHRFDSTFCSQCGGDLGPGNFGTSDCRSHQSEADAAIRAILTPAQIRRMDARDSAMAGRS